MTLAFPDRPRRAFITGITGQDGSYLAELLLAKGYEVHGIKRRSSSFNTERVDHLISDWHERDARLFLHFADLSDGSSISTFLYRIAPDEIYHLAAQSHVRVSFDIPACTGDITALGTTRLLDAIRETGIPAGFYNAASSEMFGQAFECPQTETTAFRPRSPYGCAKLYSYWMTVNAREGDGLFVVNGILFNHESPRRGEIFVSRKVTRVVARKLRGRGGDAFNLASSAEVSIHELARTFARITGYAGRIPWNPNDPQGALRRVMDVTRAEKEFGFRARRRLADGLRETVEWYRSTLPPRPAEPAKSALAQSLQSAEGTNVISPLAESPKKAFPAAPRTEVKARSTCRSCGGNHLESVLDLGNPYVSNFADVPDSARWPRVPLDLLLCRDCGLAQLRHTTPGEWLYSHYWYKSGISATMRAALADVARKAAQFAGLGEGDSVLDIGCNDGTLLRSYPVDGIRRVGFEPAANLACQAAAGTDRIVPEFFTARPVAGDQFRLVTSIAMFYDLEDPNQFVADVAGLLMEDGAWIIEMHYLPLVLERNAFDAICHEHLEYYSLSSLEPLLARHGLAVADVETNEVNGGSFRVYVVHRDSPAVSIAARQDRVADMRARENFAGLSRPAAYDQFKARVQSVGAELRDWLRGERDHGKEISVYGASTKGNTLLQAFALDHTLIRSAAERNPEKWGKFTVGTWIPIVSEAEARVHADDFLVLPWHFMREIQARESDFLVRGGKLIAPLPAPRVITANGWQTLA